MPHYLFLDPNIGQSTMMASTDLDQTCNCFHPCDLAFDSSSYKSISDKSPNGRIFETGIDFFADMSHCSTRKIRYFLLQ